MFGSTTLPRPDGQFESPEIDRLRPTPDVPDAGAAHDEQRVLTPDSIRRSVADLLDALALPEAERAAAVDLADPHVRQTLLPLAVVEARNRDDYQILAGLIDARLAALFAPGDFQTAVDAMIEILDLAECFDVLCYVGFRRAKLVGAAALLDVLEASAREAIGRAADGPLSRERFRHITVVMRLARGRFDTLERDRYAALCETVLEAIGARAREHLSIHELYQLARLFAYPARVHPISYAPFLDRVRAMIERYFAAETRHPLRAGDNIVKETAIAIVVGRHDYGLDALRVLQRRHELEQDEQKRRKIAQRLVEVAYYAGYDDVYGLWKPYYLRLLLNNKHNTYHRFIIAALMRFGRHERALKQVLRVGRRHPRMLLQEAIVMRNLSRFEDARAALESVQENVEQRLTGRTRILSKAGKDNFSATSLMWAARLRDELAYVRDFDRLSRPAAGESGPRPDGDIVVLCPSSFYAFLQIPPHVIAEARRSGASLISLVPGFVVSDPVAPDIDRNVANAMSPHYYTDAVSIAKGPSSRWSVDFPGKRAEINGINFYFCLHNTLGITFRCYDVPWDDPIVQSYVFRYMTAIESLFDKHDRLAAYCRASGRRARLLLTEIQHGLAHALRLIAERRGSADVIEVFHLSNGFEAYHQGIEKLERAQFQCIANVTRHPDVSLAYRPPQEVFEAWMRTAPPQAQATAPARAYAARVIEAAAAARAKDGPEGSAARRRALARRPDAPVIVMLGKILPDLPRPDDVGFIHEDVKAWFVDACLTAHRLGVNLVLKPHPAEFASLISLYVNQDFLSFLREIPEEAHPIVVDRFSLPITDLPHLVDGVMLWGGNSMVELGLLGLPTLVSGRYGALDCPVGLPVSDTREAFENFIAGRFPRLDADAVREKTIAFLSYVTDARHTIPAHFNNRSMYNSEIWPPRFDASALAHDPELRESARRMAGYLLGEARMTVPGESV